MYGEYGEYGVYGGDWSDVSDESDLSDLSDPPSPKASEGKPDRIRIFFTQIPRDDGTAHSSVGELRQKHTAGIFFAQILGKKTCDPFGSRFIQRSCASYFP